MEAADINNISEMEIMNMFPNIIEGGIQIAAAKGCGKGLIRSCCSGNLCCCDKSTGLCIVSTEGC